MRNEIKNHERNKRETEEKHRLTEKKKPKKIKGNQCKSVKPRKNQRKNK